MKITDTRGNTIASGEGTVCVRLAVGILAPSGAVLEAGRVHRVADWFGIQVVGSNRGRYTDELPDGERSAPADAPPMPPAPPIDPGTVQTRDPAPETRDPAPARKGRRS